MIQQTIDGAAVKIPDGNDVMRGNSSRREIVWIIYRSGPKCTYLPPRTVFVRADA
jgi:hypothetical protein